MESVQGWPESVAEGENDSDRYPRAYCTLNEHGSGGSSDDEADHQPCPIGQWSLLLLECCLTDRA